MMIIMGRNMPTCARGGVWLLLAGSQQAPHPYHHLEDHYDEGDDEDEDHDHDDDEDEKDDELEGHNDEDDHAGLQQACHPYHRGNWIIWEIMIDQLDSE